MAVTRQDFLLKRGVYSVGGKDGEWVVHAVYEQPYITMKDIKTGEVFDMPMQSMHNVRAVRLRELAGGEETAPAKEKVIIKEIEKELTQEQVDGTVNGVAKLMLSDGAELVKSVLELKGKPTKKLSEQLNYWLVQVVDFSFEDEEEGSPEEQEEKLLDDSAIDALLNDGEQDDQ